MPVTVSDAFLFLGSIMIAIIVGALGNALVTGYYRWKDGKSEKWAWIYPLCALIFIFFVAFLYFVLLGMLVSISV